MQINVSLPVSHPRPRPRPLRGPLAMPHQKCSTGEEKLALNGFFYPDL